MNNCSGYKQKHHIKNGGGNKCRAIAMLDITKDANAEKSINYVVREANVIRLLQLKEYIISI